MSVRHGLWDISDTMADELSGQALYDALMALKPVDLSEADWAKSAGKSRGYLSELKQKNSHPRIDTLRDLLAVIGKTMADLAPASIPLGQEVEPAKKPFAIAELDRDVPVLGTAEGARLVIEHQTGSAIVESTIVEQEPYEHKRRPPAISRNLKVYALYIAGESMRPRFRNGDLVYVDARRSADVGDDVIIQLIEEPQVDADPAEVRAVLIKTLVRRTADFYELEQYNPELTFRVPRDRVAAMHRVIPLSELMS